MGTSVLNDAKLWLTGFCSMPDNIIDKIEEKLGRSPGDTKIRWTKRSASEIDFYDSQLTRLEKELEKPHPDSKRSLQERFCLVVDQAKAIKAGLKEKIDAKLSGSKTDPKIEIEISSGSCCDAEDYEKSYEIIEVHNHLFVVGGSNESDPISVVEAFDCMENKWQTISPLPIQTTACSATTIPGMPAMVVIGGYAGWRALNTVQKYDFVTKKWEVIEHMRKRRWGCLALGTDHGIFVSGGCDHGSVLRSVELFSIKKNQWYRLSSMQTPRCNFAGAVIGNKVIVAGGGSGFYFNSAMRSVELFDGVKDNWTYLPPMKHKRYGCTAVARNGMVIVVGGCNELGQDVEDVEVFDEKTRQWSMIAPLPMASSLTRALLIDNNLVVFGADGVNSSCYKYDFDEEQWSLYTKLPNRRNGFSVANIGV